MFNSSESQASLTTPDRARKPLPSHFFNDPPGQPRGLFDQLLIYTDGEGMHGALATSGEIQWSQPGEWATGGRIWSRQANVDIPYGVADLGNTVAAVAEEGIIVAPPETGEAAPMIGVAGRTPATVAEMPLLTADLVVVAHNDADTTAYRVSR